MSAGSSCDDVAEISLQLRGLCITVRGPTVQATQFVAELSSHFAGRGSSPSEWIAVSEAASPRSSGSIPAVSVARPFETRAQILASFPDCPQDQLSLASRLGGSLDSGRHRIRRAWVAGHWAAAVLSGRAGSPSRSEQLALRPRYYVVVRAEGLDRPACFASSGSYFNCIGSFVNSNSISHSFPSETEARVYCCAAGIDFPLVQP